MKKLLIDIDEVICTSTLLDEMNKFLGTNYKLNDFHEYYIDDILGSDDNKTRFYKTLQNIDLYKDAELFDNVVEILKKLSLQFEIYICSNCVMYCNKKNSGIFYKHKYDFLIRNFLFIDQENFIFTGAKNIFKADVQIDDRLNNLTGDVPIKLLFDSYHNHDISEEELIKMNIKRVYNWKDIANILLEL